MKKLITFLIAVFLVSVLSAQLKNDYQYVINAYGGLTIGGTWSTKTPNPVKVNNWTLTGTTLKLYNGATQYSVGVAPGDQVAGVAVSDTASMLSGYARKVAPDAIRNMTLMGSSYKAMSFMCNPTDGGGTSPMAAGSIKFIAVYLESEQTITGVKLVLSTAGDYTASNYNGIGLYNVTSAGDSIQLVASSTDDGTIWKTTASTLLTKALSTPYVAAAGLYYVALLYNSSAQTTAPVNSVKSMGNAIHSTLDYTNAKFLAGILAGKTSLTAKIKFTAISPGSTIVILYLY